MNNNEIGVVIIGLLIFIVIWTILTINSKENAKFDVGVFFGVVLYLKLILSIVVNHLFGRGLCT